MLICNKKIITALIFILLNSYLALANVLDSTMHKQYALDKFHFFYKTESLRTDTTTLSGFQIYNPVVQQELINSSNGNIGLAYQPVLFKKQLTEGFELGLNAFDIYLKRMQNTHLHQVVRPFTQIDYVVGRKVEQNIHVLHTQNIRYNWNATFEGSSIKSVGNYARQQTNHTNIHLHSWYHTPNKRYFLIVAGSFNKLNAQENGGIKNLSDFENNEFASKLVIPVNLSAANNQQKYNQIYVKQFLNLNKDIARDSLIQNISKVWQLGHEVFFDNRKFIANTSNKAEYQFLNIAPADTTINQDFLQVKLLENNLSLYRRFNSLEEFGVTLKHQAIAVINANQAEYYQNITAKFVSNKMLTNNLYAGLNAYYAAKGYNKGDFFITLHGSKYSTDSLKNHEIKAETSFFAQSPNYIFKRFDSNYLKWQNNFDQTLYNIHQLSYYNKRRHLKLSAQVVLTSNFIYFNQQALPEQTRSAHIVGSLRAEHLLKRKWLNFKNHVVFQKVMSGNAIRLPEVVAYSSLFYEDKLFRKAMMLNLGVDVFYNTRFYANNYQPIMGYYYLQDATQTGNYPLLDIFVNFRVKTLSVFVKYEHISRGWLGYKYYFGMPYPMSDGGLKVGLSWQFFN